MENLQGGHTFNGVRESWRDNPKLDLKTIIQAISWVFKLLQLREEKVLHFQTVDLLPKIMTTLENDSFLEFLTWKEKC